MGIKVGVKYAEGATPLRRMTPGSSGYDLAYCGNEVLSVEPGETVSVPTGIRLSIPKHYEGSVRGQLSMPLLGFDVPVRTIDSDYRGEIKVFVRNTSATVDKKIRPGNSVGQIIFALSLPADFVALDEEVPLKERGEAPSFGQEVLDRLMLKHEVRCAIWEKKYGRDRNGN